MSHLACADEDGPANERAAARRSATLAGKVKAKRLQPRQQRRHLPRRGLCLRSHPAGPRALWRRAAARGGGPYPPGRAGRGARSSSAAGSRRATASAMAAPSPPSGRASWRSSTSAMPTAICAAFPSTGPGAGRRRLRAGGRAGVDGPDRDLRSTTRRSSREGDWVELDYDLPSAAAQSGLSQYELLTTPRLALRADLALNPGAASARSTGHGAASPICPTCISARTIRRSSPATEAWLQEQRPDLVVISGDFTQRARVEQFREAARLAQPARGGGGIAIARAFPAITTCRSTTCSAASPAPLAPLQALHRRRSLPLVRERAAGRARHQHRALAHLQGRADQPRPDGADPRPLSRRRRRTRRGSSSPTIPCSRCRSARRAS